MNYFEYHINDHAEATSHLSFVEYGAYNKLMQKCLATERPLPLDIPAVHRLVGARSKIEKKAVDAVLHEFFTLLEDGWHNKRCDEVIAKYQAGEPDRKARRANEELRLKRFREERARLFEDLRKAGDLIPWNISMPELRSRHAELQRLSNAPATDLKRVAGVAPATEPATPATATQFPSPNSQFPLPNSEREGDTRAARSPAAAGSRLPEDWKPTPPDEAYARQHGLDPAKTAENFRDYWIAQAGARGRKANWTATWRTWCRREAENRPTNGHDSKANGAAKSRDRAAWAEAETHAAATGFRPPAEHESIGAYTQALKTAEATRHATTNGRAAPLIAALATKFKSVS